SAIRNPQSAIAKIADFGLAKGRFDSTRYTRVGSIIGTPCYMAPEQAAAGQTEVGPAVDIYSLGAILYECLTGRPPFQGSTVSAVLEQVRSQPPAPLRAHQPDLPADLEWICLKCLAKDPGVRYATAQALAEQLEQLLQAPVAAPCPSEPAAKPLGWY